MTKQAMPREVGSHAGLGPLPKTEYTLASGFAVSRMPGYSADQMRAYAAAAVAAERERCAKQVEDTQRQFPESGLDGWLLAAEIRAA